MIVAHQGPLTLSRSCLGCLSVGRINSQVVTYWILAQILG